MTIKSRLKKLERELRIVHGPCPNHGTVAIISFGDPMPEESEISLCRNCGRPGKVLVIKEIIVDGQRREIVKRNPPE